MRRASALIALSLALAVTSGCALGSFGKSAKTKERAESAEIVALKAQITELKQRLAISDVETGRLERRLAELERGIEAEARKSARAQEPSLREPASVGEVPVVEVAPPQPVAVEESDLPQQGPTVVDSGEPASRGEVDTPKPASKPTLTASAQALYDRGYTLYHRGLFVDSETAFQQFLRGYSETVLGDNAQFWIAEARFARGDVSGALAAYRETASRFPDGNKAPDALLKAGECLLTLGDPEGARRSFRGVIDEFPGSAAAAAARERLASSS